MTYLPDSNILINGFKGQEPEATFLKQSIKKRSIVISVIAVAEFLVKATTQEENQLNSLLKEFESLPIYEKTARAAADYRKQLSRKTKKTFLTDCFLAAQAKVHGLTLITNNKADFPMKDIKILTPGQVKF